jgi:ABC-type nickel/cobalt efflux system permease component RcnA
VSYLERFVMPGLDQWLAQLGDGASPMLGIVVAMLLGARHATDPDHLTAVSALILGDDEKGGRQAAALGLFWGLGHATTLFACGLPMVLVGRALPEAVQIGAEFAVGLLIAGLAVRLLLRWRRGYFHSHRHRHGGIAHTHPHVHEHARRTGHPLTHGHQHREGAGRSPLAAFGIGLLHGAGGSAAVGIVLMAAVADPIHAVVGLLLFAGTTAVSMAFVSAAVGYALVRGAIATRLERLVPIFATLSLAFGVWYAFGALA